MLENFCANVLKSLNRLAPVYLHELFSERHTDYDLRDSFLKLNLPKPRTNYLKRSFGYRGALLWNCLRLHTRLETARHPRLVSSKFHENYMTGGLLHTKEK